MKKMLFLSCLLTAGALFAANGIAADHESEKPAAAAPQDLQAQALEQYIRATLTPDTARTILTWTSGRKRVAVVDANGVVTALKKGTAKITARTSNRKKATIVLKVVE